MEKTYSIIIPVLNRLEAVKLLYKSIYSTHNIKILLIDNGSNKETVEFIKMVSVEPRTFVTFDSFNKGAAYARNAGLTFAFNGLKSDGVIFIDSDVVLGKGCIDELINLQEKTGAAVTFSSDQKKEGFSFREFMAPDFKPTFKNETFQTSECCLISKKTFQEVGYFDEMFYPVYVEDMDYLYRVKLTGGKMINSTKANHYHFKDNSFGENEDFNIYKMCRYSFLEEYYIYKWGGSPSKEKFKKPFNSNWKGFPRI